MPRTTRKRPKPKSWQVEAEELSRRVGGELVLFGHACVIVVGELRLAYTPFEFDGRDETLEVLASQIAGKVKATAKCERKQNC